MLYISISFVMADYKIVHSKETDEEKIFYQNWNEYLG